jgi:peptidoglycan/LPS O-acetylase OafA/YrhL
MPSIKFDSRTSNDSQSGCLSLLFPLLIISVVSFVWNKYGFANGIGIVAIMVAIFIVVILSFVTYGYIKDKREEKKREADISNFKIDNSEERNLETIYH